ncbi:MAG TPA: hypothetical protein VEK11_17560 [Thermoanaerobaculia bacterium]|nr:hypothetical protein [Thermoanaerobaculia bacterium]
MLQSPTNSRSRRWSARSAAVVLRAERNGIRALAVHADRALRTQTARRCAASAFEVARYGRDLESRPSWTQLDDHQYCYVFGGRRAVLTVPNVVTTEELAAMIARLEVRILLGDAGAELVTHLQSYAARELERLFTAA